MFPFFFSKKAVEDVQRSNKICILDIDTQGVKSIRKTNLNPVYIFMKPPTMQILEERLRARSTETEESLQKRLKAAEIEMNYGLYNFCIEVHNVQNWWELNFYHRKRTWQFWYYHRQRPTGEGIRRAESFSSTLYPGCTNLDEMATIDSDDELYYIIIRRGWSICILEVTKLIFSGAATFRPKSSASS